MRAMMVVLALVATPFLTGASQSVQGSDCDNGLGDEHRSDSGQANAHHGLCAPQPPPPPPPPSSCPNPGLSGGTGSVTGQVYTLDLQTFSRILLGGWCVELRDPVSGAVLATAVTSDVGDPLEGNNYLITGLPAGTYTVCEVLPSPTSGTTWVEDFPVLGPGNPDCGNGVIGWSTMVIAGGTSDFISFRNHTQ